MAEKRFNVVFRGEVLDDFTPEQVRKNIAAHYGRDVSELERLFSGSSYVIGKQLDWSAADRLTQRFQSLGALVYVEEIADAPAPPPASARIEPASRPAPVQPEASDALGAKGAPDSAAADGSQERAESMPGPAPVSRRSRWRYRFDTFMARGGSSIFKALVAAFAALFVSIGLLRGAWQWLAPASGLQYEGLDFLGNLYITFLQLTDPGNMAQDILSAPGYKLFAVLAGLSGVIMLSALIAFITTALDQKINELKRGRSKVIESGHTLILGWNEQRIVEVIRELVLANESEPDGCVVILADRDKEEMDDILRLRIPERGTTRIVTRSGRVSTLANLDMVSLETCRSAIVLALCDDTDGPEEKAASDAMVIQTILAATGRAPEDDDFCVVAEIYDATHRQIVESTFPEHVVTVNTSDILAKLLVQTSRSVGLSVVYNEILSFDGCEMYFFGTDWKGLTFGQIGFRFPDGVPMGIRHADGSILLNPPSGIFLQRDDEILIVADDDSTIEFLPEPVARPRDLPLRDGRLSQSVEQELVLGWNHKAPIVLREFADYVMSGSRVDVLLKSASEAERAEITSLDAELESLEIRLIEQDFMDRGRLMAMRPFDYDNIIILAGSGGPEADVQQIDSANIVTLLLLRSIFAEHSEESADTKLITEVLDSQNYPLVARAGVKDVIISNRLVSMIMAQVSESRDIKKVYDDIFQEDGSEIYLKPASLYFDEWPAVATFADLMALAAKREEICIGVKTQALEGDDSRNNGVELIPDKRRKFALRPEDCLVVLAEDEL